LLYPNNIFKPVGWEKLPVIPQKEYLQIIPTDFVIAEESPVVSVKQL
jgi:hypothetical protein